MQNRKTCLVTSKTIRHYEDEMNRSGIVVSHDSSAKTVEGKDADGATVFRAMAKDANTWLATFLNTPCVKWGF